MRAKGLSHTHSFQINDLVKQTIAGECM